MGSSLFQKYLKTCVKVSTLFILKQYPIGHNQKGWCVLTARSSIWQECMSGSFTIIGIWHISKFAYTLRTAIHEAISE